MPNMSSQPLVGALLFRSLRVYQIYGANTEVGKTVFSTILCKLASRYEKGEHAAYLKPVSTGPLSEADDGCRKPWSVYDQRTANESQMSSSPETTLEVITVWETYSTDGNV